MTRTTITSRVGTDGMLSLSVPLGLSEANVLRGKSPQILERLKSLSPENLFHCLS